MPKAVRDSWRPMVEGFLERRREGIRLAVLLVDARHGTRELDLIMRDWVDASGVSYVVVATKAERRTNNTPKTAKAPADSSTTVKGCR